MPPSAQPRDLRPYFRKLDADHLANLSVNTVVFGAAGGTLKVLLMRWFDLEDWGLPSAYVRKRESVDDAAARATREVAGISGAVIRQFHTFGEVDRGESFVSLRKNGFLLPDEHWAFGRVVSVCYLALVDAARVSNQYDGAFPELTNEVGFWDVADLPPMMLDHESIVGRAVQSLRDQLINLPLSTSLLADAFTMTELQRLHETVEGRQFDRRNFQKRMLELGLVERLPEKRPGSRRRLSYLYRWVGRTEQRDRKG